VQRQPGHPVRIAGTGAYLPGEPIAYDDIDKVLGEFDQADEDIRRWYPRAKETMRQLLGMEAYYFAVDPKTRAFTDTPSTLAAKAATQALDAAGMGPEDVDILFYAGCSQDAFICPPTSTFVQQHLGIANCAEISIHSNCTSTYKAIQVAADQIAMGRYRTALVTSANMVSGHAMAATLNQKALTRHQAMLRLFLCDGGGALVLTRDDGQSPGFEVWDTFIESAGGNDEPQMYSRYGSASIAPEAIAQGHHHVTQNMQMVGSLAVDVFIAGFERFAQKLGLDLGAPETHEQIRWFLANVPSDHLVEATHEEFMRRYGLPPEVARRQYYSTVAKRGYTGPAAIAVALDQLWRNHAVPDGKFIISFVTESSKWMNAGFLMRRRD
jgi:3-oxoacyl-[acyl-carrier-protein] synthase-3